MILSISNFAKNENTKRELDYLFSVRELALDACYSLKGYKNMPYKEKGFIYGFIRDAIMSKFDNYGYVVEEKNKVV